VSDENEEKSDAYGVARCLLTASLRSLLSDPQKNIRESGHGVPLLGIFALTLREATYTGTGESSLR